MFSGYDRNELQAMFSGYDRNELQAMFSGYDRNELQAMFSGCDRNELQAMLQCLEKVQVYFKQLSTFPSLIYGLVIESVHQLRQANLIFKVTCQ